MRIADWNPAVSAPEIWRNKIDLNLDEECANSAGIRLAGVNFDLQTVQADVNANEVNVNEGSVGIWLGNYSGAWVHDNSEASYPGAGVRLFYQHSHTEAACGIGQDF